MYKFLFKNIMTTIGRYLLISSLAVTAIATAQAQAPVDLNLPTLGNVGGNMFSDDKKYELGRAWLMAYRAQVPTNDDPILYNYIENLVYTLAQHSQLSDRRMALVIVSNPTLNAFALTGGVVGVNDGIFLSAKNEAQLASILSHELAHLSQHHLERRIESQQKSTIPTMAGMLAGLVLAATTGSDAGIAAITATQAAAMENRLRFSRQNEQEADRIGMKTMFEAGMDPRQSSAMFEEMQRANRYYGNRVPEFLLTHPLTEARIADAKTRADRYPKGGTINSLDYTIVQARVKIKYENTPKSAIKYFKAKLKHSSGDTLDANHYGLAIAQIDSGLTSEAEQTLRPLLKKHPNNIAIQLAKVKLLIARNNTTEAKKLLENLLQTTPNNYPLMQRYAELLQKMKDLEGARDVWLQLSKLQPNQPAVWFQLSELEGLVGNIKSVHTARAEYFLLSGGPDTATRHLRYALKLVEGDYRQTEIIQQRIRDIETWKQRLELK